MTKIKILDRTYTVPTAPAHLDTLKVEIQQRSERVRLGQRPGRREKRVVGHKTAFLFFKGDPIVEEVQLPPEPMGEDERLRELETLVSNYDAMIGHIKSSQRAYERFFGELAQGVQQAVEAGTGRVREMERRRAELDGEAQSVGNEALAGRAREIEHRLMRSVRIMAQATLLLLRKIALCEEGLRALAGDHEAQQKVLAGLRQQIDLNRRLALLERDVAQFEKDVEAMARMSLQFETYMRDYFGPLQSLLEQIAEVDERFHGAVQEIEDLTRVLLDEGKSDLALPAGDDRLLDILVKGTLDRDMLGDLLDRVEQHDERLEAFDVEMAVGEASIENALANVEALVQVRLEPLLELAPPPATAAIPAGRGALDDFVIVEPNTFWMGSGDDDPEASDNERPRHEVILTTRFAIQRTPITQRQWLALMGNNPSHFKGEDRPVEQVSWFDAVAYCNARSRQEGLEECYAFKGARGRPGQEGFAIEEVLFKGKTCPGYRLPTEAEWECACRAGTSTPRYGILDEIAWYGGNSVDQTHPVGQLKPNAWGLHDMLGNVWEWCWDGYSDDCRFALETSPEGSQASTEGGVTRVKRGGGWDSIARSCRAAFRRGDAAPRRRRLLGFRLARSYD